MADIVVDNVKKQFRTDVLKIRNSLTPGEILDNSERICKCICADSKYVKCRDILLYSSFGSEVKTSYLFERALADKKNVYFPKVTGTNMDFYKVTSINELNAGFKGILEPFTSNSAFNSGKNAIVIVPGTVFGKDGYRIGYGKGYYDRFLARFPDIYKIGICHSIQLVPNVPYDEFDVRMDEIICESYILNKDGNGEARWI